MQKRLKGIHWMQKRKIYRRSLLKLMELTGVSACIAATRFCVDTQALALVVAVFTSFNQKFKQRYCFRDEESRLNFVQMSGVFVCQRCFLSRKDECSVKMKIPRKLSHCVPNHILALPKHSQESMCCPGHRRKKHKQRAISYYQSKTTFPVHCIPGQT